VVDAGIVGPAAGSFDMYSFGLTVRFRTLGGRGLTVLVRPLHPTRWPVAREATVEVRYDPANPSSASYAGAGGDTGLSPAHVREQALVLLAIGILMAFHVASRRGRLGWALRRQPLEAVFDVSLLPEGAARPRIVRTAAAGRQAEEWRLLWGQQVADDPRSYRVHEIGGWRVLRGESGSVLWPASRGQPVLEAETVEIPRRTRERPEAIAIRAWLAACEQIEASSRDLPALVRRPPGVRPSSSWWRFGPAPGVAVRLVVRRHIRARLRYLSSGLTAAVVGPRGAGDVAYREAIRSAREDCADFARRLSRPPSVLRVAAVAVSVIVGGLELYAAYFQVARPNIPGRDLTVALQIFYVLLLAFAWLVILVASRSVRCAKAQLGARTCEEGRGAAVPSDARTIHDLESEAFEAIGVAVPRDRGRYLPSCLWIGYAAVPLSVSTLDSGLGPTLQIVVDGLAVGGCILAARRLLAGRPADAGRL